MRTLEEATEILRAAEHGLRDLIAAAAGRGDYDDLPRLAEWAKQLNAVLSSEPQNECLPGAFLPNVSRASIRVGTQNNDLAGKQSNGLGPREAQSIENRPAAKGRGSRQNKKLEYPKFFREGDNLIKVGWSKGERKTYEHRAPRRVLDMLVQTLIHAGQNRKHFTMEDILPLKDSMDNSDIPNYQTYLALAWLRGADLITQHGRQGYSLPPGLNIERESDRRWGELRTR